MLWQPAENLFKNQHLGAAALTLGAKSYSRIIGANDRVRVGIVGFSDRFRTSLAPAFLSLSKE
jgi:hypothetical protein